MTTREFIEFREFLGFRVTPLGVIAFRVTPLGVIYVSLTIIPAFSGAQPNGNAFHA
jgi:hypothetical protein